MSMITALALPWEALRMGFAQMDWVVARPLQIGTVIRLYLYWNPAPANELYLESVTFTEAW